MKRLREIELEAENDELKRRILQLTWESKTYRDSATPFDVAEPRLMQVPSPMPEQMRLAGKITAVPWNGGFRVGAIAIAKDNSRLECGYFFDKIEYRTKDTAYLIAELHERFLLELHAWLKRVVT